MTNTPTLPPFPFKGTETEKSLYHVALRKFLLELYATKSYADSSGGASDHGELSGLGDDDHTQYHNDARGDARYSQLAHNHDHGALTGKGDDDHPQYLLVDGTRAMSGELDTGGNRVLTSRGTNVASASSLELNAEGNIFHITGTTTITGIDAVGIGVLVVLYFEGSLTLTHSDTDLRLPGGANIQTQTGDAAFFYEYEEARWQCLSYQRVSGPVGRRYAYYTTTSNSSNVTSSTGATDVKIPYVSTGSVTSSDSSMFSISSNEITVNEDGNIRISVSCLVDLTSIGASTGRTRPRIILYKNGSTTNNKSMAYIRDLNNKSCHLGFELMDSASDGDVYKVHLTVPYADSASNTVVGVSGSCYIILEELA